MTKPSCVANLCENNVVTVAESATIKDAAGIMRKRHVGSLVVTHETPPRVAGILTDRDIAIVAVARDFDPLTLRVDHVMSSQVHTINSDSSPSDALQLMRKHGVRRLPVTDHYGYLVGILTLDDLLDTFVAQLGELVHAMQHGREHEEQTRV
jgi:CBS domain-containing protein